MNAVSAPAKLLLSDSLSPTWQKVDSPDVVYTPHFDGSSVLIERAYARPDRSVGVYLGYYRDQDYSRKLVSSNNVLVMSMDTLWSMARQGAASATLDGKPVTLRSAELRRLSGAVATSPDRLLVWQLYWINGRWTSNDYLAKIYSAVFQLMGRGDDSAVLVIYTAKDRTDAAEQALSTFLADNHGAIDTALSAAAASR
jgi:EpsI family protein